MPDHGDDARDNDALEMNIAEWVVDHPEAIVILERFGIDYCCGGKSVRYACSQAGIDPQCVFDALKASGEP